MDKTKLFPIGEVSKLFHISVSSLRHYENVGLLTPEYVSPDSGYRYYGASQFEILNTIRYLRVLGLPLSEIEDIYNEDTLTLPEMQCVRLRFCGSHTEAPEHYDKLLAYIADHSMLINGFSREITLIDYGVTSDPEKFVTEICIPVSE